MPELSQEEYDEIINNQRITKFQLQEINNNLEGGLTSRNFVSFRNTYVVNAQDSLDDSYPMYVHFNIIDEMIKIVSVKVDFWILNYRAYSTAASSGGAVSSASGGGETPTTEGGGVVTSASGGEVTSASGGGSTPTSSSVSTPSGGSSTSGAGGYTTPSSSVDSYGTVTGYFISAAPSYSANIGDANINGFVITQSIQYTLSTKNHTHTVTIPNHYHSTPNHTHPNHAHTVTIAAHTHTGGAHTHTGGSHTHTVTIAAHTHTGGAHAHDITYGIFEEETSPTIKFYVSENEGVSYSDVFGGYIIDKSGLDITSLLTKSGSKLIRFISDVRARLAVQIMVKLDISAR